MPSHKFGIDFSELEAVIKDLERAGGNVKQTTEKALIKSHEYVTPLIKKKLDVSNLPAKGKYSSQERKHSLKQVIEEPNITWDGTSCEVDVGFNLKETLVPIYLIRGTKDQAPVKGLKSALEGNNTQKKIAEIQEEVFFEAIENMFKI